MSSKRPRCGVDGCRSRRYHVDNGLTYCHRGHLQEGHIEEAQDFEDVNWSASQTTRIRDSQKQAEAEAFITALGGPGGLELYLVAYQHLLQKQCWIMTKQKGFDARLEGVVKDLWKLRVGVLMEGGLVLGDRVTVKRREKGDVEQEGDSEDEAGRSRANRKRKRTAETLGSEPDTEDEARDESQVRPPRSLPRLIEQFALIYIGAVIQREPLPLSKLQKWIQEEDLHYVWAHEQLSQAIRSNMPGGYAIAFQPRKPLRDGELHACIAELSVMLHDHVESLKLPPINTEMILMDYLVRLALPLMLFEKVMHLIKLLELDFTTTSNKRLSAGRLLRLLPEVQLVALIVVAAKLHYPLDGSHHVLASPAPLDSLMLNWATWDELHTKHEKEREITNANTIEKSRLPGIQADDVWDLNPGQLETWLDWYQDSKIMDNAAGEASSDPNSTEDATEMALDRLKRKFPLPEKTTLPRDEMEEAKLAADKHLKLLQDMHASLEGRQPSGTERKRSASAEPETGGNYAEYRLVKHLAEDQWALVFHQRVAEKAGIPLPLLLRAVWSVEVTMAGKKPSDWGDEDDEDSESAISMD